jgi:hypothetical protein
MKTFYYLSFPILTFSFFLSLFRPFAFIMYSSLLSPMPRACLPSPFLLSREREREKREMLSPNFNEHFFQLKSLHSVHYEAAVVAPVSSSYYYYYSRMLQWKALSSPDSAAAAGGEGGKKKSNCGLEWNEREREEERERERKRERERERERKMKKFAFS